MHMKEQRQHLRTLNIPLWPQKKKKKQTNPNTQFPSSVDPSPQCVHMCGQSIHVERRTERVHIVGNEEAVNTGKSI